MKFDFPIDKIEFEFDLKGDCQIDTTINETQFEGNIINGDVLKSSNILKINFRKNDPSDTTAYAKLTKFEINGGDFLDQIKTIEYHVDNNRHRDAPAKLQNNLYFGYIGEMYVQFEQTTDQLKKAAWLIANEKFDHVKWPTRNKNYREKSFENVYDDYRFMFTGCHPPSMKEIDNLVNDFRLGSLIKPIRKIEDKAKMEKWINNSKRVNIRNLSKLKNFTLANGTTDSLFSFLMRHKEIHMPQKMYHHNRQILEGKDTIVKDLDMDRIIPESTLLLELPSPWHSDEQILKAIKQAKEKDCYIAIDLSWLPVCMEKIQFDAFDVDEIFFSMNKCWPIHSVRPSVRWSKQRINDSQTFDTEVSIYPKIPINVMYKLIDRFSFDYSFDLYINDYRDICKRFDLKSTSVLWFTTHEDVTHDGEIMEPFFYLDDFVCVVNLLANKNKFFW